MHSRPLAYARAGRGFPLVFVHGYLGSARMWQGERKHFQDRFDVIAPDLAGFGDSADIPAPERIDAHADMVLALLDRLGVDRFCLVGHSMGGMVAQQMAITAGERIARLVLYGTGPVGNLPDRFETTEMSRQRLSRDGIEMSARHIAATWFVDGEKARDFPMCAEIGAAANLKAALASTRAWDHWDCRAELGGFTMPTLIVWGEKDRSVGWRQCEMLWRGIPKSSLAVCPGTAHNVHLERPDLFRLLLGDFLDPVS